MYCVLLDGLHFPKHAILHPKVTAVLQEDEAVARGKAALAIIGLEAELASLLAFGKLTSLLKLATDPLIDGAYIDATMSHGDTACLRMLIAIGQIIPHNRRPR